MPSDKDNGLHVKVELVVHSDINTEILKDIQTVVNKVHEQGVKMATTAAELKKELVEINSTTNEIASDIDDLVSKVGTGGSISETDAADLKNELLALKSRLTGIAAVHTPESV